MIEYICLEIFMCPIGLYAQTSVIDTTEHTVIINIDHAINYIRVLSLGKYLVYKLKHAQLSDISILSPLLADILVVCIIRISQSYWTVIF